MQGRTLDERPDENYRRRNVQHLTQEDSVQDILRLRKSIGQHVCIINQ